ncbi:MAG: MBL fold metallo-hydrolase [Candidatus Scalindua sp. AMX11]|nr:MAG: MBL fold metallo-hydrolase [Candidatus Scalindua sp.]NOG83052.1 MBL fold metallo-hydrolase [Planctomycetota bacterium]RZV79551.1 MAG: MBL fold metallo-hydrolase [Candidatus Scalindua sp. SCAELEC01]TDE65188.1 MAG: MBL fold metallo-hydrolase [Candidatus Scalindua sp. AMX11]GJQ58577.1 MAG: MBL fold metallo-hydrolase [Candidatus Scalindua sp.]
MYFKQIKVPGIGCFSYVVGCPAKKVAAVIDPKRDIQDYLDIAKSEGMKITHVIETHIHADHVSGNQELRKSTGADIYLHEAASVAFDHKTLREGDIIDLGAAKLEVLFTPGHTPNSLSLLVTDKSRSKDPWILLSGDLVFVGDIGRPDLAGEELLEKQVEDLHKSIYQKLGKLPGSLEVFPAHGQGSLCGKGMSSRTSSTLGFERDTNPLLNIESLDEFKKSFMQTYPARPKNFSNIIAMNTKGVPLLASSPADRSLSPLQFQQAMNEGAVVIDTRDAAAYGGVHIPDSINIGFGDQMANWIGMAVAPESNILLVFEDEAQYRKMCTILYRIGYDNILGYLQGGIPAWQEEGFKISSLPQMSVHDLKSKLDKRAVRHIVDVRTEAEWNSGHIEGAEHLVLTEMLLKGVSLPKNEEIIVTCRVGYRGNIAASYLQQQGFSKVGNLAGGMKAWANTGFPVQNQK